MRTTEYIDLPLYPSRGNRRELEELWLQNLELQGRPVFIASPSGDAPPELSKAIIEFNGGLFWECHETLEALWRDTPYPARFFYHAIIKLAVSFHHLSRHNRRGARLKLFDGVRLLRLFPPRVLGIQTGLLSRDATAWLQRLEGEAPLDWKELDRLQKPQMR